MIGYYGLTFTNSAGDSISIGATLPYVISGIIGLDAPPVDLQSKRAPFQDGTTPIDQLLLPRDLTLNFSITGITDDQIYVRRAEIGNVFNSKLGSGTLTITYESETRSITCRTESIIMPNTKGNRACGYQRVMIEMVADNPAILDAAFTSVPLAAFTGGFSLPFIFPISFGTVGQEITIDNTGHYIRPIIITMTGPLESPTFTNETTGEVIALTNFGGIELFAGETLTVDTTPATPSITITDGVTTINAYKYLSSASVLWQLILGENDISYVATAQGGTATVNIKYKKGYSII